MTNVRGGEFRIEPQGGRRHHQVDHTKARVALAVGPTQLPRVPAGRREVGRDADGLVQGSPKPLKRVIPDFSPKVLLDRLTNHGQPRPAADARRLVEPSRLIGVEINLRGLHDVKNLHLPAVALHWKHALPPLLSC